MVSCAIVTSAILAICCKLFDAHFSRPFYQVLAKGKGEMQTYWLSTNAKGSDGQAISTSTDSSDEDGVDAMMEDLEENKQRMKTARLVNWTSEVMLRLIKQIVARRNFLLERNPNRKTDADETVYGPERGTMVIEEVKEIIELPEENFNNITKNVESVYLDQAVVGQLHQFVSSIAMMYNNENPFHNFEHASHVTMSVCKLLSRIVAPSELEYDGNGTLHDHTYGITSDPLTQLACVFSALIHDADHPGVPNAQLVKEGTLLAANYKNKSVAEQNSIDLAWGLFMQEPFQDLRKAIYTTASGLRRFRELVVNATMATDIVGT